MKTAEFLKILANERKDGPEIMMSIIPEGGWICDVDNKDFSENYFWGYCSRCGCLIGSTEEWYLDSDHCVDCHQEDGDDE